MLSDTPAQPASDETSVNLVVDGEIVRERHRPRQRDPGLGLLRPATLPGPGRRRSRLIDMPTPAAGATSWPTTSPPPTNPRCPRSQRADWLDYGKDYYAAVSWNNVPGGKRFMIGWMSNWQYAGEHPHQPWRGAMTIPRELALETIDGEVRLTQRPVEALSTLRSGRPVTAENLTVPEGSTPFAGGRADGKTLEIEATFSLADGRAVRAQAAHRRRRGDLDRLRRRDPGAVRRPDPVGRRRLQRRLPRRPPGAAGAPRRQGPDQGPASTGPRSRCSAVPARPSSPT